MLRNAPCVLLFALSLGLYGCARRSLDTPARADGGTSFDARFNAQLAGTRP